MLVVSIRSPDLATLRLQAQAQAPFADLLELRLDDHAHASESDLRALIASLPVPTLVAVNSPQAFGTFSGTRAERFTLLDRAARAGARFIDVDFQDAPHQFALPATTRRVVSRHILDHTPADLATPFTELTDSATREGDIVKLVTHAQTAEDGVRLLEFARGERRECIVFASGERGSFTRVLAPIFGSAWTYAASARLPGSPDSACAPTAPGQLRADEMRSLLPRQGLRRDTEIFAVLGRPVAHSLSPRLHTAAFQAAERNAVYVAIEPDDLGHFLRGLKAPNWRGFSVTAPFKEAAFALSVEHDDFARASGAVNTLSRLPRGWKGLNTDVAAVYACLERALARAGLDRQRANTLVVGSGGAARAAIFAALHLGLSEVCVSARDDERSATLARQLGVRTLPRTELASGRFDVVLHCTPAGSRVAPGELAVPLSIVRGAKVVLDAVYRPERTPLVEAARAAGCAVVPGKEWFLEQALLQGLCFTPGGFPTAVMGVELEHALAEDEG